MSRQRMSFRHPTTSDVGESWPLDNFLTSPADAGEGDVENVVQIAIRRPAAHPKYGADIDYWRLKSALHDDLAGLSYEDIARVSWLVGELSSR